MSYPSPARRALSAFENCRGRAAGVCAALGHGLLNGSTGLNRHAVMHGESLDYDTKGKQLAALSFLNYVALDLNLGEGSDQDQAATAPLASLAQMANRSTSGSKTTAP